MEISTVSENDVERLRSDMDTIQSAMGRGLPFGKGDIRYSWIAAGTLALYGVLYHFGIREGGMRLAAIAPFLVATAVYVGYMALRSRRSSGERAVLRKEYRLAVFVILLLCGGLVAIRPWAVKQGIELDAFNGIVAITLGLAVFGTALIPFNLAVAFRRASLVFAGIVLMALGWIIVTVDDRVTQHAWIICDAVLAFVGNALLMIYFMGREESGNSDARTRAKTDAA